MGAWNSSLSKRKMQSASFRPKHFVALLQPYSREPSFEPLKQLVGQLITQRQKKVNDGGAPHVLAACNDASLSPALKSQLKAVLRDHAVSGTEQKHIGEARD